MPSIILVISTEVTFSKSGRVIFATEVALAIVKFLGAVMFLNSVLCGWSEVVETLLGQATASFSLALE